MRTAKERAQKSRSIVVSNSADTISRFVFGCLEPFVILRTLRSDCLYWQGMYSPGEHSLNSPLMGGLGALRKDSVETIASMLTDLRHGVKQIPYGMVSFEDKRRYAAGASARVYKGHLYNASKGTKETVAIKMLFCMELNAEVRRPARRETATCKAR